jgi:hypothetical protein
MTTSDKTGEKLVESVRRTKTTAAAAVESAAPPKRTPSGAGKRAAIAPEAVPDPAPVAEPAPAVSGRRDHYSSVGRVWPD